MLLSTEPACQPWLVGGYTSIPPLIPIRSSSRQLTVYVSSSLQLHATTPCRTRVDGTIGRICLPTLLLLLLSRLATICGSTGSRSPATAPAIGIYTAIYTIVVNDPYNTAETPTDRAELDNYAHLDKILPPLTDYPAIARFRASTGTDRCDAVIRSSGLPRAFLWGPGGGGTSHYLALLLESPRRC